MRGRKPFRIPQIPKKRTLSPATGHDRDRHRSHSRSRISQRSTGSKASLRSRPSESPEYSPSDRGRKSRRSSPPKRRSPRRRSPTKRINSFPKEAVQEDIAEVVPPERSSPKRHSRRSRSLSRSDGIIYLLIKILLITLLINFYNRNKINSNNIKLSNQRNR